MAPKESSTRMWNRPFTPRWKPAVPFLALGVAAFFYIHTGKTEPSGKWITAPVEKGAFRVTVRAKGKLEAAKSVVISCPISWKPITWILPEGTIVKKDQVIIKFDQREIEDTVRSVRSAWSTARAKLDEAQRTLEFEKQKSASQVETNKAALEIAKMELANQRNRPRSDELKRAEVALRIAQAVHAEAKSEYETMRRSIEQDKEKAVFSRIALEKAQMDAENAKADLDAARVKFDSVSKGASREEVKEAELRVTQAEAALRQSQQELPNKIDQLKASVQQAQAEVDKSKNQLDRQEEELSRASLTSPAPGMIVYRQFFGRKLAKGMTAWNGAALMDLPDISKMLLKAQVRETEIGQVLPKQKVDVFVDALPGKAFQGVITEVGKIAKDSSETEVIGFDQKKQDTGVKVFDVTIAIDSVHNQLKPSMVAKAEIVVCTLPDVLHIPADALFRKDNKTFVTLCEGNSLKQREVQLAQQAENRVAIKSGLRPGDRVCLKQEGE